MFQSNMSWIPVVIASGETVSDPVLMYDGSPFDIPTLCPTKIGDTFLCLGRDFNAEAVNNPPSYAGTDYLGFAGLIEVR